MQPERTGQTHWALEPVTSAMTCSLAAGSVSGCEACWHRLSTISCRWVASPNSDISPSCLTTATRRHRQDDYTVDRITTRVKWLTIFTQFINHRPPSDLSSSSSSRSQLGPSRRCRRLQITCSQIFPSLQIFSRLTQDDLENSRKWMV